jgi:diguanylate cyclase (GGDEF)-like protein
MKNKNTKKDKSVFRIIFKTVLLVLVVEIALLACSLELGGIIRKMNQNSDEMLAQQVENRKTYLLNEMVTDWSQLDSMAELVNSKTEEMLAAGKLSLDQIDSDSTACAELLEEVCPELINSMYRKKTTGVYVIFNTSDLADGASAGGRTGLYLRDLDPTSLPSQKYSDILIERAPVELVRSMNMATDGGWSPTFSEADSIAEKYLYMPYEAALNDTEGLNASEFGYWTSESYCLENDNRNAISYSIPLILDDGTVYGVIGVELLTEYIRTLLPCDELLNNEKGTYILGVAVDDSDIAPVVLNSDTLTINEADELNLKVEYKNKVPYALIDDDYSAAMEQLTVYNNNGPFDSEKWYLIGVADKSDLYAFSIQVRLILLFAYIATFIAGLIVALFVSLRISRPIARLSTEVSECSTSSGMPELSKTNISEIDQFSSAITKLSHEVVDASRRFLNIMDMVSVELAGYELSDEEDGFYVTDNFFTMLGRNDIDVKKITRQEFEAVWSELRSELKYDEKADGSELYKVQLPDGRIRYLRGETTVQDNRLVGVIEDTTNATLEKMRVEKERDCDLLTGLYTRRAFRREAEKLMADADIMKQGGLLMIDLDNLKKTNDRFGHSMGDLYIKTAAACFAENTPDNTLVSRISGDEFLLLFYGYNNMDEILEKVDNLYTAMGSITLQLPNGEEMGISASGGIAWYPQDSVELSRLSKYADFAMYQMKLTVKGQYAEFDFAKFEAQLRLNKMKQEFHRMLVEDLVFYHFQPIYSSASGKAFAYEALLRVNLPTLRSPETIMQFAKEENKLYEIERISIFKSSEYFKRLRDERVISKDAYLFMNSIASVCLSLEENDRYHEMYSDIQSRVVVEITEAEDMNEEYLQVKRSVKGFSGLFALDDYGSGYNTEKNLLMLNPQFVKVDISIIRDIDKDDDKQQIVRNIVEFAHKRNMMVVSEGIETAEELKTVLQLGTDLLQGFYLAKPAAAPNTISPEAYEIICQYNSGDNIN